MTAKKIVLLILDGISDRPCPALNGQTPLQAADTPNLDRIAKQGICGIMDTIAPGIRPGSDTAHLSLLGYPPHEYYTGRGPLEAEGTGIHMEHGMIGVRANYATIGPDGLISDRRAGRIHDTAKLSRAIEEGVDLSAFHVTCTFRSGAGHRAALALKGDGLGSAVTSNDPKSTGLAPPLIEPLTGSPGDSQTSSVLNEFVRQSSEILADHHINRERKREGLLPANIVLLRGAGQMGHFEPFSTRYGMQGSVISAAALITGIGRVVGLTPVQVPGITGSVTTNLSGKVTAICRELKSQEFVLANIKGSDEAGHDGDPIQKRDFISRIDTAIAPLLALEGTLLVVCGDHSTPCSIRDHSADPVPLAILGDGVRIDRVAHFNEIACAEGGLTRISGGSLMPILTDLVDRAHKYGA